MENNWLSYTNQGAVRSQPLSPDLIGAMSFLPELGVTMEVFSGGQDAQGPNRVGSTRHDHGNAADVMFSHNGRQLNWANPADRPIFEEIVSRGRAAGISGFGAGDGYMREGSMHLGFGDEAVWGAGGSGANAPDWLTRAYGSSPQGRQVAGTQQQAQSPQMTPQQAAQQQQMATLNALPQYQTNALNAADFQTQQPQNALSLYGFGEGQSPFSVR